MNKSVLIVGTGMAGLSTGLRLASRGYKVRFVEKNSKPGGRLNQLKEEGFTFDTGPSFFSMPYEFHELVQDCGIEMPFRFVELDPLYTVNFKGSDKKYSLYKDIDMLSQQFIHVEPDFKIKFQAYLKKCAELYNDTVNIAIKRNFDNITDYILALFTVNPKHLPVLLKTFWAQTGNYFKSKEARRIVSLIAFFLGRTPFDTNAIYTLLSHIEFTHTGYYNVEGGMYTIVQSMVNELEKMNAVFHYNTHVTGYRSSGNRLTHLTDSNNQEWQADIFVINSDAAHFRGAVFNRSAFSEKRLNRKDWTMGYLTIYVGVKTLLPQVEHHNYYLGNNYEDYAHNVMRNPDTLQQPYYYVNRISKNNPGCAPANCEALFFVCPMPNLIYKKDWSNKQAIIDSIIKDFSKRVNKDISKHIVFLKAYTPIDWQEQFSLFQGAGLGLSHKMLQIGALRPKNYDEKFLNTFYTGASTIPGAGLPMAVISSKLTAERVYKTT